MGVAQGYTHNMENTISPRGTKWDIIRQATYAYRKENNRLFNITLSLWWILDTTPFKAKDNGYHNI